MSTSVRGLLNASEEHGSADGEDRGLFWRDVIILATTRAPFDLDVLQDSINTDQHEYEHLQFPHLPRFRARKLLQRVISHLAVPSFAYVPSCLVSNDIAP